MPDLRQHDPRVYFAAERTLLAWIRTGVAIMAFGFVVARFGLFLKLLRLQSPEPIPGHGISPYVGAGLVFLGATATLLGALEYRRYCRQLLPADMPSPHATVLPLALAVSLVAAGGLLVWTLLA